MADETPVNNNSSQESNPPVASSPAAPTPSATPAPSTPPSNPEAKPKSNAILIVALVVFGLLILGAVIFFAGGYSLEQGAKPTPTITQTNQEEPTTEPTEIEEAEETPTPEVTESTSPTTSQNTTPTTGQTPVTTTQTP